MLIHISIINYFTITYHRFDVIPLLDILFDGIMIFNPYLLKTTIYLHLNIVKIFPNAARPIRMAGAINTSGSKIVDMMVNKIRHIIVAIVN